MKLRSAAASTQGLVRPRNEDRFLARDDLRCYAVADGVGGLPGGQQAAERALLELEAALLPYGPDRLADLAKLIREVHGVVRRYGLGLSAEGIGTTLSLVRFVGNNAHLGHVGDSAVYRVRPRSIDKLTADHTMARDPLLPEEVRRSRPNRTVNPHALTRCVGQNDPLVADATVHGLEPGDRYLLCTDGVTRALGLAELHHDLFEPDSPEDCARLLVQTADERGGHDNATAVVIFIDELS